jgi:hypothetical protein
VRVGGLLWLVRGLNDWKKLRRVLCAWSVRDVGTLWQDRGASVDGCTLRHAAMISIHVGFPTRPESGEVDPVAVTCAQHFGRVRSRSCDFIKAKSNLPP